MSQRLVTLPAGLHLEEDHDGHLCVFVRRDMYHLDADALNDHLHAWIFREVQATLPLASALVSFQRASPATMDDADLDVQEAWHGLEPTFRIDLHPPGPSETDLVKFAALVPTFLKVVRRSGRPADWRDIEEGNAE